MISVADWDKATKNVIKLFLIGWSIDILTINNSYFPNHVMSAYWPYRGRMWVWEGMYVAFGIPSSEVSVHQFLNVFKQRFLTDYNIIRPVPQLHCI